MKNHFDNIYSNRAFKLRHPGDTLKDEIIFELVQKFSDKNSGLMMLDVGCGMGHTSLLLSDISSRFVGIDTSIEGIKIAKGIVRDDVLVADCIRLPFQDECFNIVVMKDVLVYINNDVQAIKEINRVLQTNGLLILYVPYSLYDSISFESIIKRVFGYSIDKEIGFVRRYNIIELNDILDGFEIVKSFYFAHFLFGIISIFGVYYDKTKKSKIKKEKEEFNINKNLLNLLLVIIGFIKLVGKVEFLILRNIKGAGMFTIIRKK
ncbi:Ubiquinone biosynthesis O-methyltransferase [uncultured archaeon]|nr:Ubiquinone biosynthesis O-methyltransferase [uncultured archaeon]